MAEHTISTEQKYHFRGGSNINHDVLTCKDDVFILSITQSWVLNWLHTYILHPVLNRKEATISQYLCWTGIRNAVQKEANICVSWQCTKWSNIKYDKLSSKEAE